MSDYGQSPDPNGLLERLLDEAEAAAEPSPSAEAGVEGDSPPESSRQPQQPSPSNPPASPTPMLEMLLSNPSLLAALPGLLENLTPLLGGIRRGASSSAGSSGGNRSAASVSHRLDRHTALLCALKPYLSPSRREAAETVIRLCRVWDALERSGISLTGLLRRMDPGDGEGDGEKGDGNHVQ